MAISGLVITTRTAAERAALADTLAGDERFTLGPARANRLTAVLELPDAIDAPGALDEDVCRWLWTLPGVVLVDVAAVHLTTDQVTTSHVTADVVTTGLHPVPELSV